MFYISCREHFNQFSLVSQFSQVLSLSSLLSYLNMRLRSRGLSPSSVSSSSSSHRRTPRLESLQAQVGSRREETRARGCPRAPPPAAPPAVAHNTVDLSVIVLDETLQARLAIYCVNCLNKSFLVHRIVSSNICYRRSVWRNQRPPEGLC